MLYLIFGTNFKKREKARQRIILDLKLKNIDFDKALKKENEEIKDYSNLEVLANERSLFGEVLIINFSNILEKNESREYFYKNIENFIKSENIFIFDEMFSNSQIFQKLYENAKKFNFIENVFDSREDSFKKDINPFPLCDFLEKRDKKRAWLEWNKLYNEWGNKEDRALHGAIWWKWKNIWKTHINNKNSKYKQEEIEKLGKEIAFLSIKANNGELDLMKGIEKLILSI